MLSRPLWLQRIRALWERRPIVWLSGVRRVGKTTLARQIEGALYLNCDLPSTGRQLADPEAYLAGLPANTTLILDEVHRLADPSLVLKVAADAFPHLRLLATGSSTLAATRRFRDSLTGRKYALYLPPVLWTECADPFGVADLDRRLLHGGLPEMLLAERPSPDFFQEWIDSFYARDVQALFGVRNRTGFLALLHLLLLRSGGLLAVSDLAKEAALSRPTVMAHLDAMEIAHAIFRLPPYHGGGHREIIRRPKLYAFDTGLVAHVRGWEQIRETDRGPLWEHLVLDHLRTVQPERQLHYWRDKSGREIDFVVARRPGEVDTVEAKISPEAVSAKGLAAFRASYPEGRDFVVCPTVAAPYTLRRAGRQLTVCTLAHLPYRP